MRSRPQIHLIRLNSRITPRLVRGGVVARHVEPGGMIEPVDPRLGVRLCAFDGADVVGLAVVVPGDDLY